MKSFQDFLNNQEYRTGWDETAYGLLNWGSGRPDKKTPRQWAAEMIKKIEIMSKQPRLQGALDAMKTFLKNGEIDYLGTSGFDIHTNDENRPSPFSAN